jgi:hypothetical protein
MQMWVAEVLMELDVCVTLLVLECTMCTICGRYTVEECMEECKHIYLDQAQRI